MLVSDQERLKSAIVTMADEVGRTRASLIPLLQMVQDHESRITDYAMQVIADVLDLHPVEVYSVVSFYHFLTEAERGTFVIRLCRTISCDLAGKQIIASQLENDLGIRFGETTPDGRFTLEYANCIGMCDQGPALLVNDDIYTRVTPAQVHDIIEECRSRFGLHALHGRKEHH